MAALTNGRYDESKGYFSWRESLYYDDIDHTQSVHHAYYLRFFEHAREHMLGQDFLPTLLQAQNVIIVATKTDQKHANFDAATLGDTIEIRTRVEVHGAYRIVFQHEAWRSGCRKSSNLTESETASVLVVSGSVEMVCLDATKLSLVPLPEAMTSQMMVVEAVKKSPVKPMRVQRKGQGDMGKLMEYVGTVSDVDTDFTNVVYQAKYLQYYEAARKALFRKAGCLETLAQLNCFCAVYKAAVAFKNSLGPDDQFKVKTRVNVDGRFRLEFSQTIEKLGADGDIVQLVNSAEIQVICVDRKTRKMIEFPVDVHRTISNVTA